jgi:antitoxin (DNA-binding transcriptional repressor) of toxin-antitoxin stability system
MVASEINEQVSALSSAKSLTVRALISSTNSALSPVIDLDRTSLITISNKINNPTESNINVTGIDDNVVASANTNIAFSAGNTITSSDTATKAILAALIPGKYLTISGSGTVSNNGTFLITAVASDGASVTLNKTFSSVAAGTAITLTQRERFVDEIVPLEGSTYSAYVTRKINFANPSKFLRLQFAGNIPKEAAVEVYYKTNNVGSVTPFDQLNYTLVSPDSVIINYDNSTDIFQDITYSLADLPSFDAASVKIVMKSTNTSAVPIIKDFRMIACA